MQETEKYLKVFIKQGKMNLQRGDKDSARDYLDKALVILAESTLEGVEKISGKPIDRWKVKVWNLLEKNDLLILTEEEKLSA